MQQERKATLMRGLLLSMANDFSTRKVTVWAGFVLLCLITSLEWVIPPVTTELPTLQRSGLLDAVIGLGAGAVALLGKRKNLGAVPFIQITLAGIFFLGVPAILLDLAGGIASSTTVSLLFTLTPVVVVITAMSNPLESAGGNEFQRLLLPSLAGIGGVLSILPFSFPDSRQKWFGFAVVLAVVTIAGVAGVWLHRRLEGASMAASMAIIGITNGVLLLGWSGLQGGLVWRGSQLVQRELIAQDIVQAAIFLLTLWLVREMSPVRLAARYLVIPLLTIGEGLATMRPPVTGRLIVGIVLLAAGASYLLITRSGEGDRPLSLR
jgi:hypothetical protein